MAVISHRSFMFKLSGMMFKPAQVVISDHLLKEENLYSKMKDTELYYAHTEAGMGVRAFDMDEYK